MKYISWVLKISLLLGAINVAAEVAVIVHPSNTDTLDQNQIVRIFLGKAKSFPSGASAKPVNLDEGHPTTEAFNDAVLSKSSSQLKAYWSKLVFTGKGTPPKELSDDIAMLAFIAGNTSAIGYIDASKVTGDVKVIATF